MLRAILNKSWRQHPTKQQLYGHQPPITKTIKVRRTRHAGHCWRSRDKFISDVLLWNPSHGRAKVGKQTRTYIQQLCADMECSPEDLTEVMDDREGWQEMVKDICVTWYIYIYIYIYICSLSRQTQDPVAFWLICRGMLQRERRGGRFSYPSVSESTGTKTDC